MRTRTSEGGTKNWAVAHHSGTQEARRQGHGGTRAEFVLVGSAWLMRRSHCTAESSAASAASAPAGAASGASLQATASSRLAFSPPGPHSSTLAARTSSGRTIFSPQEGRHFGAGLFSVLVPVPTS